MEVLKEILKFTFSLQSWRIAIMWSLSLIFSYFKLYRSKEIYSRRTDKSAAAKNRPICVVTGATSGLGAAAAFALSKEGYCVVLVGRSSDLLSKVLDRMDTFTAATEGAILDIKSKNGEACLKAFQVDVSSFDSILKFSNSLHQWLLDSNMHPSVQLLINNAGILATTHRLTSEGYDQMMATNYIGAFFLTKVLLPLLENSPVPSRVVNVSSFTHWNVGCRQVDKETVSGKHFRRSNSYPFASMYEYSKFCVLLFSYELHRQVCLMKKSHHLSVIAADPGGVDTNILREFPSCISQPTVAVAKLLGLLQPSYIGVRSIIDAALAPPEVSGVYFFGGNGRTLNSSALSYDSKLAKDLWATSSDLFQDCSTRHD